MPATEGYFLSEWISPWFYPLTQCQLSPQKKEPLTKVAQGSSYLLLTILRLPSILLRPE